MIFRIVSTFKFEIIIESHAVVRSNRGCFGKHFAQFLPTVTSYITTVQYHNQDNNIDTIY